MNTKCDEILPVALALPGEERARLAQELLRSLDESPDAGASAAWAEEIERRIRELDSGLAKPVDWPAARERILRRLSERRAARDPSRR
ncbi:MAG: addiction module protein [Planctomycetes bacterium]|nr:addiction module protein [Planctomycetota bacterium]